LGAPAFVPAVSTPTSLIDPPLVATHVSVAPSIAFSNVPHPL